MVLDGFDHVTVKIPGVFVFCAGGAGPQIGRAGAHIPRDQPRTALPREKGELVGGNVARVTPLSAGNFEQSDASYIWNN